MDYIIEKLKPKRVDKKVFERGFIEDNQKKTVDLIREGVIKI